MSDGYPCPEGGKCHGCMKWCDVCGDVDDVCDAPICWQHRCVACNELLNFGEREMAFVLGGTPAHCFTCYAKHEAQHELAQGLNELPALARAADFIAQFQRAS